MTTTRRISSHHEMESCHIGSENAPFRGDNEPKVPNPVDSTIVRSKVRAGTRGLQTHPALIFAGGILFLRRLPIIRNRHFPCLSRRPMETLLLNNTPTHPTA